MANSPSSATSAAEHNIFATMLPITLAVFVGFLTIGLPLPVLPLHLHYTLGLSNVLVGVMRRGARQSKGGDQDEQR